MAIENKITGITNANSAAAPAAAGRQLNILSIKLTNTSNATVVVDLKDGNTVFDSLPVGPYGETWHEWAPDNQGAVGKLLAAGNAFNVASRAASGAVEATTHYGRR